MISRLEKVSLALTEASQASEGHFLALGELLAEMHPRAQELVQRTRKIQSLAASGGPLERAVDTMAELHAPLEQHTQSLLNGLSGSLSETEQAVAAAFAEGRVVRHAVHSLQFLRISQRIESERLGETDRSLSNEFEALSTEVGKEMEALFLRIEAARERLARHKRVLLGEGSKTQSGCQELGRSLQTAIDRAHHSISQAASVGAVLEQLACRVEQALDDSLGALQTHDIVRQRIEHVVASWVSMGQEYASLNPDEANHSLHLMASIQERQLDEVNELMNRALSTLLDTMRGLGCEVAAKMQSQIQVLVQSQLVNARRALSQELPDQAKLVDLLQEGFRSVDTAVVGQEIEALQQGARRGGGVAERVRRLALNAQIRASRLDNQEAAAMIASQTRLVADDCVGMMVRVQDRLSRAGELSHQLSDLLGGTDRQGTVALKMECPREVSQVVDGLDEELKHLHLDSNWLMDTGPEVDHRTHQAGQMAPELMRGLELMREIRQATEKYHRPEDDGLIQAEALVELRASYSMEGERQVLDEVLGRASERSDFSNVELF